MSLKAFGTGFVIGLMSATAATVQTVKPKHPNFVYVIATASVISAVIFAGLQIVSPEPPDEKMRVETRSA